MNRTLWAFWGIFCGVSFFFMALLASWSFWFVVDLLVKAAGHITGTPLPLDWRK